MPALVQRAIRVATDASGLAFRQRVLGKKSKLERNPNANNLGTSANTLKGNCRTPTKPDVNRLTPQATTGNNAA
jgi:hypothetical protein